MTPRDMVADGSDARYAALLDAVSDAVAVLDELGVVTSFNRAAERIFGYSAEAILDRDIGVLMPGVARDDTIPSGRRRGTILPLGPDREIEGRRSDGSSIPLAMTVAEWRTDDHRYATVVMRDVSERRWAEDRQRLLVREVDHRARNALAVVQSILRLSVAEDMPSYVAIVEERIAALARIHSRIAIHRWEAAPLGPIVDDELAILDPLLRMRVQVGGPEIWLSPTAAQSMALAIHELTTNLRRHGVLGTPTGGVTVHWRHDEPHDDLVVTWVERNGSAIAEGPRERFGFEIVRAVIEIQLEGSVQLDWSTGALICRLGVPVRHLLPRPPV